MKDDYRAYQTAEDSTNEAVHVDKPGICPGFYSGKFVEVLKDRQYYRLSSHRIKSRTIAPN